MSNTLSKLRNNSLFRDSFWAVCGNGMGNGLLLIAGIVIARLLGKDMYGEYGVVKTTMLYISGFATLGTGVTSTKFIAQHIETQKQHVKSIIHGAIIISLSFSTFLAIMLILFSDNLASYLNAPGLKYSFQALAAIIVFKSLTTTQIGILAGFKNFSSIAKNSMLSGLLMFCICIPLTYYWGLSGSFTALFLSQAFNTIINFFSIKKQEKTLTNQTQKSYIKEIIRFSLPVALQESSYTFCHWGAIMFLAKCSSTGELGLYSAAAQWSAIILMVPTLLNNVILSYLSSTTNDSKEHQNTKIRMLQANVLSTFLPFIVVFLLADFIATFYGHSFYELPSVLRILTLSTIFESMCSVYKAEFMARGAVWSMFTIRFVRDVLLIISVYLFLSMNHGENGAQIYSWIYVCLTTACLLAYMYFDFALNKNIKN